MNSGEIYMPKPLVKKLEQHCEINPSSVKIDNKPEIKKYDSKSYLNIASKILLPTQSTTPLKLKKTTFKKKEKKIQNNYDSIDEYYLNPNDKIDGKINSTTCDNNKKNKINKTPNKIKDGEWTTIIKGTKSDVILQKLELREMKINKKEHELKKQINQVLSK